MVGVPKFHHKSRRASVSGQSLPRWSFSPLSCTWLRWWSWFIQLRVNWCRLWHASRFWGLVRRGGFNIQADGWLGRFQQLTAVLCVNMIAFGSYIVGSWPTTLLDSCLFKPAKHNKPHHSSWDPSATPERPRSAPFWSQGHLDEIKNLLVVLTAFSLTVISLETAHLAKALLTNSKDPGKNHSLPVVAFS